MGGWTQMVPFGLGGGLRCDRGLEFLFLEVADDAFEGEAGFGEVHEEADGEFGGGEVVE